MKVTDISSILSSVVENLFHSELPKPEQLLKEFQPKHLPLENLGDGLKRLARLFETPKTLTPMAQAPGDTGTKVDSGSTSGTKSSGTGSAMPTKPSWISDEEVVWFNSNGGLQPSIIFDKSGIVEVNMKKPGLDLAGLANRVIPFEIWKKTNVVEASFNTPVIQDPSDPTKSTTYFYTGTRVFPGGAWMGESDFGFNPVVTKVTRIINPTTGDVKITWKRVELSEAKLVLSSNKAALQSVLNEAKIDKTADQYITHISERYGAITFVEGSQEYNKFTGYYRYRQQVNGPIVDWLNENDFASGDIKGAALKIAYFTIDEPARAGAKGTKGPAVPTMQGPSIQPGK